MIFGKYTQKPRVKKMNLFYFLYRGATVYVARQRQIYSKKIAPEHVPGAISIIGNFPLFFAATESLVQGHDVGQLVVFVGYDVQLRVQQRLLCCQEFKIRTVG